MAVNAKAADLVSDERDARDGAALPKIL